MAGGVLVLSSLIISRGVRPVSGSGFPILALRTSIRSTSCSLICIGIKDRICILQIRPREFIVRIRDRVVRTKAIQLEDRSEAGQVHRPYS